MRIPNSGVAASVIALVFKIKLLTTHDSTWHQAELALCVYVYICPSYAFQFTMTNQACRPALPRTTRLFWLGACPPPPNLSSSSDHPLPVVGVDRNRICCRAATAHSNKRPGKYKSQHHCLILMAGLGLLIEMTRWNILSPPIQSYCRHKIPLLNMDNSIRNIQSRTGETGSQGLRIFTSKRYGLQTITNL